MVTISHDPQQEQGNDTDGCFICRHPDPAFADVEGCSKCEQEYVEQVVIPMWVEFGSYYGIV